MRLLKLNILLEKKKNEIEELCSEGIEDDIETPGIVDLDKMISVYEHPTGARVMIFEDNCRLWTKTYSLLELIEKWESK